MLALALLALALLATTVAVASADGDGGAAPPPPLHLVIPCYNEATRLPADAYVEYVGAHPTTQFTFVNDGSTDATLEALTALSARAPAQLHVLPLPQNGGKAEAVRAGLQAASAGAGAAELVGFWDADLATPLDAVESFTATLQRRPQTTMVFGARVALLGRQINRLPSRHYLGRIFATLASSALSLAIYDTQCGAKVFRNSPALRRVIAEPFTSRWIFDVELIARFVALRRHSPGVPEADPDGCWEAGQCPEAGPPLAEQIFEYPLMEWTDIAGSKIKLGDKLRSLWELGEIWYRYQYCHNFSDTTRWDGTPLTAEDSGSTGGGDKEL